MLKSIIQAFCINNVVKTIEIGDFGFRHVMEATKSRNIGMKFIS